MEALPKPESAVLYIQQGTGGIPSKNSLFTSSMASFSRLLRVSEAIPHKDKRGGAGWHRQKVCALTY